MKGAGSLEVRDDASTAANTVSEERSESQPSSEPGAFNGVVFVIEYSNLVLSTTIPRWLRLAHGSLRSPFGLTRFSLRSNRALAALLASRRCLLTGAERPFARPEGSQIPRDLHRLARREYQPLSFPPVSLDRAAIVGSDRDYRRSSSVSGGEARHAVDDQASEPSVGYDSPYETDLLTSTPLETLGLEVVPVGMRLSTKVVLVAILLIVIPIPVLPPFVGSVIGVGLLLVGLFLRFMGL